MKWGVRNEQQYIGNGLTLRRNKLSAPARLLRKVNPNMAKEQGKHYASTVMDWTIKTAKANGNNQLTLEVPSISPDARHVYENEVS